MTRQITRWFEYGEPVGNRVEARLITEFETGPNEPARPAEIERGTVAFDAFTVMDEHDEIIRHTHDDFTVMLSGLSDEAEEALLETFEPASELELLIREGCTPPEAADYLMVESRDWSQTAWANVRGVVQASVSENVSKAREKLDD